MIGLIGITYILLPEGKSEERLPFMNTVLLTIIMFLVMISQILPSTMTPPVLSRLMLIMISVLALIITTVIIIIYAKRRVRMKLVKNLETLPEEEQARHLRALGLKSLEEEKRSKTKYTL